RTDLMGFLPLPFGELNSQPRTGSHNRLAFKYDSIQLSEQEPAVSTWLALRSLYSHGKYDPTNYVRAETYLRQTGHTLEADTAFIDSQIYLRDTAHADRRAGDLGSWINGLVIGYGRLPQRALAFSAVLVLGAWVTLWVWFLHGGRMVPRRRADEVVATNVAHG